MCHFYFILELVALLVSVSQPKNGGLGKCVLLETVELCINMHCCCCTSLLLHLWGFLQTFSCIFCYCNPFCCIVVPAWIHVFFVFFIFFLLIFSVSFLWLSYVPLAAAAAAVAFCLALDSIQISVRLTQLTQLGRWDLQIFLVQVQIFLRQLFLRRKFFEVLFYFSCMENTFTFTYSHFFTQMLFFSLLPLVDSSGRVGSWRILEWISTIPCQIRLDFLVK